MRKNDMQEKYRWLMNHKNFIKLPPKEKVKWKVSLMKFEDIVYGQEEKFQRRIKLLCILQYSKNRHGGLIKRGMSYDDLDKKFDVYSGMPCNEIDEMFKTVAPEWDKFVQSQLEKMQIPLLLLYPWPIECRMQKLYDRGYTENQIYKAYHLVKEFAEKHFPAHFVKKLKK